MEIDEIVILMGEIVLFFDIYQRGDELETKRDEADEEVVVDNELCELNDNDIMDEIKLMDFDDDEVLDEFDKTLMGILEVIDEFE